MRILICNDDGIYAPGIMALYRAIRDLGEVHVVAPQVEQSAMGHAITLSDPIKIKTIRRDGDFEGHAVVGTPADCVKLAVSVLLDRPPDLIISGINLGPNAGISVIYSGTVSAATEGTILGIPSMAISWPRSPIRYGKPPAGWRAGWRRKSLSGGYRPTPC